MAKPPAVHTERSNSLPEREEAMLAFWQREKIFERSVNERPADKPFVFYDGPPYATGKPHIGGMLASVLKDVVPRYKTMQGYRVERRFGWDCHGLPIEVLVEKELGLNSKKDIETYGIGKFNDACRAIVLKYVKEWRSAVERIGRWVDFDNDYKTMDLPYMESALWVFRSLSDKGLVYEDYRSSLYCTRCETPLSKMETTMDDSYEDVEDPSVYVGFKKVDEPNTYFLAWTTTPWTLSANVALAIHRDVEYAVANVMSGEWKGRKVVMAKERLAAVFSDGGYEIENTLRGDELIGWRYEPVQQCIPLAEQAQRRQGSAGQAYRVVAADFVTLTDGTGIVHIAPAFGEDDFALSRRENLPLILTVDDGGKFLPEVTPYAGLNVKDADKKIIEDLQAGGSLLRAETITHSYPFCWRCHSPLIYKVQKSFYVKVSELKDGMFKTNENIHWIPSHLKDGRFKLGMESAPDWGVSRTRYWGIPIPVWRCDRCASEEVMGSLDDIEARSGVRPSDLHRPMIDDVTWACECGGTKRRVPDVFDVWFDSGSMPYGQVHYPFENKDTFESTFPADFIVEYIPQTRGWFYVMHVLSNALFGRESFRNVVATGTVLASDGTKMSKSKGNFPDLSAIFTTYGSDALRLYLLSSPVIQGEDMNYNEEQISESVKKVLLPLWNVCSFFGLYAPVGEKLELVSTGENILDRWILARLEELKQEIQEGMESYELWRAAKALTPFVQDLSTWYVRRSRGRLKSEDKNEQREAIAVLFTVLVETAKVVAPFTPFLAEAIYQELRSYLVSPLDSIHLEPWPATQPARNNAMLLVDMVRARTLVELGHAKRAELKKKVREPLAAVLVSGATLSLELQELAMDELNVKAWRTIEETDGPLTVAFDTTETEALRREGLRREFVRQINALRKQQGLTIRDRIALVYTTESATLGAMLEVEKDLIARDVLADTIATGAGEHAFSINGETVFVTFTCLP